jgi:hypothetical protein
VKNIHLYVKNTFSDTGKAIVFFEGFYLGNYPNWLDLKTLQYLQASCLTKELKEYFSDLVFEVKVKEDER